MLLVLDIGNSTTAFGLFDNKTLVNKTSVETSRFISKSVTSKMLYDFIDSSSPPSRKLHGVAITSVVPKTLKMFQDVFSSKLHIQPFIINATMNVGIPIQYKNLKTFGSDRFCNIVAAVDKYPGTSLIIDWGTATKFEVVSRKHGYLGGIIAPGLEVMAKSLSTNTAQLPLVKLQVPNSILGKDTKRCIQSGVMNGMICMTEEFVQRITQQYGPIKTIVATGGYASLLLPHLTIVKKLRYEPNLVLEGARIIFERLNRK